MSRYIQPVTRSHRTAYVIMLDLSGSMRDMILYEQRSISKAEALVELCNKTLRELRLRAMRSGQLRDSFVRVMARASSVMPELFEPVIHQMRGERSVGPYRGLGYNISMIDVLSMVTIGTQSATIK